VSIILILMAVDAAIATFIVRKLRGLVSKYAGASGQTWTHRSRHEDKAMQCKC
jgi:hypothetical protein